MNKRQKKVETKETSLSARSNAIPEPNADGRLRMENTINMFAYNPSPEEIFKLMGLKAK